MPHLCGFYLYLCSNAGVTLPALHLDFKLSGAQELSFGAQELYFADALALDLVKTYGCKTNDDSACLEWFTSP